MQWQLDIFEDSRDVTLRNDLAQAFLDDSPATARGVAETLLAEALWLAPARAAVLLPALADRHLDRLVARFEERFDPAAASGADWAWLPAFALVDQPLLKALSAPLFAAYRASR